MDDAGPLYAGDPAVGGIPGEECIDERSARVTRGRVNDQPGRLVDDEQVRVLIDDGERNRLGRQLQGRGSGISTSTISPATIGSFALTGPPAAVTWPSVISFWT